MQSTPSELTGRIEAASRQPVMPAGKEPSAPNAVSFRSLMGDIPAGENGMTAAENPESAGSDLVLPPPGPGRAEMPGPKRHGAEMLAVESGVPETSSLSEAPTAPKTQTFPEAQVLSVAPESSGLHTTAAPVTDAARADTDHGRAGVPIAEAADSRPAPTGPRADTALSGSIVDSAPLDAKTAVADGPDVGTVQTVQTAGANVRESAETPAPSRVDAVRNDKSATAPPPADRNPQVAASSEPANNVQERTAREMPNSRPLPPEHVPVERISVDRFSGDSAAVKTQSVTPATPPTPASQIQQPPVTAMPANQVLPSAQAPVISQSITSVSADVDSKADVPLEVEAGLVTRGSETAAPAARPGATPSGLVTVDGADAAHEIVRAAIASKGNGSVELRLDPGDLGKLEIEFTVVDDRLSVAVRAEREDSLDLMRRSSDELARMLRQAGVDLGSLNFSRGGFSGERSEHPFRTLVNGGVAGDQPDIDAPEMPSRVSNTRLDIRV